MILQKMLDLFEVNTGSRLMTCYPIIFVYSKEQYKNQSCCSPLYLLLVGVRNLIYSFLYLAQKPFFFLVASLSEADRAGGGRDPIEK